MGVATEMRPWGYRPPGQTNVPDCSLPDDLSRQVTLRPMATISSGSFALSTTRRGRVRPAAGRPFPASAASPHRPEPRDARAAPRRDDDLGPCGAAWARCGGRGFLPWACLVLPCRRHWARAIGRIVVVRQDCAKGAQRQTRICAGSQCAAKERRNMTCRGRQELEAHGNLSSTAFTTWASPHRVFPVMTHVREATSPLGMC